MGRSSVAYRTAGPGDFNRISEIFNLNILQFDSTLWQDPFFPEDIDQMCQQLHERERVFVLQKNEDIIGWGAIKRYHQKRGYQYACETSVFLDREFTGQGYGKPFKSFILDQCRILGYHHVNAKILAKNKASIAYNLKLGYDIVGVQKEIGMIQGEWVDVVIMQYIIRH